MIVDDQNQLVETINLTLNDLAETSNYDSLKAKIVGVDSGEGEMSTEDDWLVTEQLDEAFDSLARFFNRIYLPVHQTLLCVLASYPLKECARLVLNSSWCLCRFEDWLEL